MLPPAIIRYLDMLNDEQADRVIEAQHWSNRFGSKDYYTLDGRKLPQPRIGKSRCLVGHAEDLYGFGNDGRTQLRHCVVEAYDEQWKYCLSRVAFIAEIKQYLHQSRPMKLNESNQPREPALV